MIEQRTARLADLRLIFIYLEALVMRFAHVRYPYEHKAGGER